VNTRWLAAIGLVLVSLILEAVLHDHIIRPLQTLTNVISSLREEDYSFRARGAVQEDALGELAIEVNALADTLSQQKTSAIEATELLKRVVEEIDSPIFTFDMSDRLKLVNSAGCRLLKRTRDELLGRTDEEIGLTESMRSGEANAPVSPLGPRRRWLVRRTHFREKGLPHTLVVWSDVSPALREEERSAWQRLIRVLGHEINNSLTPIKSIAGTLLGRLRGLSADEEERTAFEKGLGIIESRSASLNRFIEAYRQLLKMPRPTVQPVPIRKLVEQTAGLETRVKVQVEPGPEITLKADPDQFEQVLINLLRNAAEASLQTAALNGEGPMVAVRWSLNSHHALIQIVDNGPGLLNPQNAFVPFYTTKGAGSGIGLVLCRQIVEAHGGTIELLNRSDGSGCIATIAMPLDQ
jgi:nitrogen fixation/metabolism regulation signal transduction histidine kinase